MRARTALLGIVGITSALVGLVPTAAVAKAPAPVTLYAYEEINGHYTLLGDPGLGLQFMDPVCTPDFSNCVTYEFADRWDVSPYPDQTDTTNVIGYVDIHAVDNFVRHNVKGTFSLVVEGVTWTGSFGGTFVGPKAGTGSFSLLGTNGTKFAGSIAFLDDGYMSMTGVVK